LRTTRKASSPSLPGSGTHPAAGRLLRHTFVMRMQAAGIGGPAIALLLAHESLASTRPYLQADLELKQRALDRTAAPRTRRGRYIPKDELLAFLEAF
jgi:integrase/recombinase XerD